MDLKKQWESEQMTDTMTGEPGGDQNEQNERKKWNHVFIESLKMALFLPLVILFTEIFILNTWPDLREAPISLFYDYLFLFSMIFLIFVLYHLLRWKYHSR